MAISLTRMPVGRTRARRECASCRVQVQHLNLNFCPNCGHEYGKPPLPRRHARSLRPTRVR